LASRHQCADRRFCRARDSVRAITSARTADLEWIGYSAVRRLEILGFAGLNAADELGLRNLLAQLSEAPIDDGIIERAVEIRKSVRIKIPDALVVATALIYGAILITRNADGFQKHPGHLRARSCNDATRKVVSVFASG
jgi:predicted nucleic acid-binding protein